MDEGPPGGRSPRSAAALPHTPWRVARLRIARLVGATSIAILGQFAVDMPGGWFGARDELTSWGAAYCLVAFAATVAEAWLQFLRRGARGRPTPLTPLILSVHAGAFVPALTSDPLRAGVVLVWQIVVLARHFLDRPRPLARRALARHFDPDAPELAWAARYGGATRHLVLVALVAWLTVVGYEMAHHWLARATLVAINLLTVVPVSRLVWILVRRGRRSAALAWLPLAGAVAAAGRADLALTALAAFQLAALALLIRQSPTFDDLVRHFYARPALFVANTFGVLILLGTLLLTFPAASATTEPVEPLDAFFTSTSAVCVTGLIVLDTPHDFSTFGQAVLLGLIQVGGLGIMVLSSFATLLLGGRIGLREERALGQHLDAPPSHSVQRATLFIVTCTLAIEALGALALLPGCLDNGRVTGRALWEAAFHSVSAFCNAGFALRSDSLVTLGAQPWTLTVIAALITLGGIGFAVMLHGWLRLRHGRGARVPLGVRVALRMSLLLVVLGTAFYAVLEWDRSLADLDWWQKLLHAGFQSVTLRTAGFNSVDLAGLALPSTVLMCVFMLVGASPGGTGGGIKTTTAAVLLMTIPAIARGETRVRVLGRTVPQAVVYRAGAIAVITMALAVAGTLGLAATQELPLDVIVFEVCSAIGTVGLSIGGTQALDPLGKYLVIGMMFVGRIGPLTLALSLGRPRPRRTGLPEETVAVG